MFRKKNKRRRKKRSFKSIIPKLKSLSILTGIAITAFAVVYLGDIFLRNSGIFTVSFVEVTGNSYIPKKNIQAIANIDTNQSMYDVKLPNVAESLLRNQYVRAVSVTRELPSTILIDVQERKPALYLVDKSIYMVDKTGLILEKLPGMPMGKAPFVTGITRTQLKKDSTALFSAIQIVRKIQEIDESLLSLISEVNIRKKDAPELILIRGGAHVKIGESKHYQRLFLLSQLLHKQPIMDKLPTIRSVDLRYQDRIIINHKS